MMSVKDSRSLFPIILPVLFFEYLATSLTKGLIPGLLIDRFGDWTYMVIGLMEMGKGLAAFLACPFFGRLSDRIGRKPCLMLSVFGTTFPVVLLAFSQNMLLFVIMFALSGFFCTTFPLTFAYISDCIPKKDRAPAYGLALATFGLSFTLGPMTGGYISLEYGSHFVFYLCALLVVLDLIYIVNYLPETAPRVVGKILTDKCDFGENDNEYEEGYGDDVVDLNNITSPNPTMSSQASIHTAAKQTVQIIYAMMRTGSMSFVPTSSPDSTNNNTLQFQQIFEYTLDTFSVFRRDEFMSNIAVVVFLYYVSVWGMVSTLMVYVTRNLHFSPQTVGWLLSTYGLSTMFSEAILVRYIVPWTGEMNSMRIGLFAFTIQAIIIAFSTNAAHIFASVFFSMITNLFYPSTSALVSRIVDESEQGEALGALNGIKAITEGFGPLLFGGLMAVFEDTDYPGAPYLLTGLITLWALFHTLELPKDVELSYAKDKGKGAGNEDAQGLLAWRH
jgi:MFS family permease